MNNTLENLITLHRVDSEIKTIQKQRDEIPRQMENLKDQVRILESGILNAKNQIKENEKTIRKNEQAIEDHRQQQGKFRTQLYKLKSNREYAALNDEIRNLDRAIEQLETQILEKLENNDILRENLKTQEIKFDTDKSVVENQVKELAAVLKEVEDNLKRAEASRAGLIGLIGQEVVDRYLKISRKNGSSVAEIIHGHCGGCNIKVRPQIASTVRTNSELINCEQCGRFLFWSIASE